MDKLDQCDIRFALQREMKFIVCDNYWDILAERVVLVVANGARIFENNELIQAQTWDDAMVDKALGHFKGRDVRISLS